MKNVLKPLTKSVSIPLGLTAVVTWPDQGVKQKINFSGTTTLV